MGREQTHPLELVVDGTLPKVRYERELTVGSIGTLWLGRLNSGSEAGRTVLLRRMSLDLFSPKDIDSIRQVAQAYSKVRHPSLVKLLGLVEQDRDLVSVSEHLDGVRMSDLLRHAIDNNVPLPATVAVRLVLDAARATIKAHRLAGELGLYPVERLFVPEGVFIAAFGGTLLTEVGVLAAIARCSQPRTIPDLLIQLSPEELDRAPPTRGSPEVFSLGVVLWEALANRHLFSYDNVCRATADLCGLPIDPLNRIERCGMPVPDALAEVARIATERHPGDRYPTLEQFVAALEQLPAHFIATEHHVASALRSQAAHLLQAFHVDPSQSSLTIAFSEVPASRLSTRPPPEGGNTFDPPTFNQSSLVSGGLRTLNLPRTGITSEPAPDALPVGTSSALPVLEEPNFPRKRLLLVGVSLLALTVLISVAYFGSQKPVATIQPEARSITVDKVETPTQPASLPAPDEQTTAPNAGTTVASTPSPTNAPAAESHVTRVKDSSMSAPTTSATSEAVVPTPATKRSGSTYRPRQIAPYRPKGI